MEKEYFEALYDCLKEIISVICYQPDIPHQHKVDMLNKLCKLSKAYYNDNKEISKDECQIKSQK